VNARLAASGHWPPFPPGPPRRPGEPILPPSQPAPAEPPRRPVWPQPIVIPDDRSSAAAEIADRLLSRRIVLVTGQLDAALAEQTAARLMLLDADGDGPIQLHVSCPDGDLEPAVMLAETLDLLRVPVHAVANGVVGGPVIAVFAAAGRRRAHPHALFPMAEPKTSLHGAADQLAAAVAMHREQLDYLNQLIARATGRDPDAVADDMRARRLLTASDAVDYGLVQELVPAKPASTR
jgi:ATP-dependent Clp protease, protease subunit